MKEQVTFRPTQAIWIMAQEVQKLQKQLYHTEISTAELWRMAAGTGFETLRKEIRLILKAREEAQQDAQRRMDDTSTKKDDEE
ncbi:MAG: hypothetical protein AAFQ77_03165 [Myxococcota bacterium]